MSLLCKTNQTFEIAKHIGGVVVAQLMRLRCVMKAHIGRRISQNQSNFLVSREHSSLDYCIDGLDLTKQENMFTF